MLNDKLKIVDDHSEQQYLGTVCEWAGDLGKLLPGATSYITACVATACEGFAPGQFQERPRS